MLQALSILKAPGAGPRCSTETFVFYLHYRVTFLMLMFACILVSTREFFGDKIQCISDKEGVTDLLNSYCWAASTYSVTTAYNKEIGVEVPHPGVGPSENESEYTYRNYYQYIHMVLFLQAILFYLPHLIWKGMNHDPMKAIFDLIQHSESAGGSKDKTTSSSPSTPTTSKNFHPTPFTVIVNAKDNENKPNDVNCKPCPPPKEQKPINPAFATASRYITSRWNTHQEFALKYIFCEVMSVSNLLFQCYLLNVFLHGEFLGLGHFFTPYFSAKRLQEPIQMFPLVTNCYFKKFGASGFVDNIDAICVLPINALNVKIYLFVWIWFAVLLGLSLWSLLDLFLSWCVPQYRTICLRLKQMVLVRRVNHVPFMKVVAEGNFGDWFILRSIKGNMEPLDFSQMMEVLWGQLSATETKDA